MPVTKISDKFFISSQIDFGDVEKLAKQGFCLIINNRPDGEEASQPLSAALAKAAKKAGVKYAHIPIKGRAKKDDVLAFKQLLQKEDGKILAFCRSGMRARSVYLSATRGPGLLARLFGRG